MMTSRNQCNCNVYLIPSYINTCTHVAWFGRVGDISRLFRCVLRFQTVSWFLLHDVIEMGDDLGKREKAALFPIVGFWVLAAQHSQSPM